MARLCELVEITKDICEYSLFESSAALYHGWQVEAAAAMATRDALTAALKGRSVRARLPGGADCRLSQSFKVTDALFAAMDALFRVADALFGAIEAAVSIMDVTDQC